jgi:hypothetical protein
MGGAARGRRDRLSCATGCVQSGAGIIRQEFHRGVLGADRCPAGLALLPPLARGGNADFTMTHFVGFAKWALHRWREASQSLVHSDRASVIQSSRSCHCPMDLRDSLWDLTDCCCQWPVRSRARAAVRDGGAPSACAGTAGCRGAGSCERRWARPQRLGAASSSGAGAGASDNLSEPPSPSRTIGRRDWHSSPAFAGPNAGSGCHGHPDRGKGRRSSVVGDLRHSTQWRRGAG